MRERDGFNHDRRGQRRPRADAGTTTTDEDSPVTITLTGSDVDGDALTFAIATGPTNGSLSAITSINDTTAEITYTPDADFNGSDSFTFTVNDGTVKTRVRRLSRSRSMRSMTRPRPMQAQPPLTKMCP